MHRIWRPRMYVIVYILVSVWLWPYAKKRKEETDVEFFCESIFLLWIFLVRFSIVDNV